MYVILVNDDNTMSAPKKQRIMQRSKLVDDLWFLVNPIYNTTTMEDCIVSLEYLRPVSKKYKSEILSLCADRYEEYLVYKLPIDTELTEEAGSVEIQLTFLKADLDTKGNPIQKVRKVDGFTIDVLPISKWADIIPDSVLSPIDQRLIKLDAQIKAINDMNVMTYETKADDLSYEDNKLQLVSNGKKIGKTIDIAACNCDEELENGVPVINFSSPTGSVTPDEDNSVDNVVEF